MLSSERMPVRNYSKQQCDFLPELVLQLVRNDLFDPNPTATWSGAPILVPKTGDKFWFTVDLSLVNNFTVKHQNAMHNVENELKKLSD